MTSWEDIKLYINRYGFLGWVSFSLIVAYLLQILLYLFLSGEQFNLFTRFFMLPAGSSLLWKQPWSIVSYFLIHPPAGALNFIFNILIIMGFAQLISVILSAERVRKLMIIAVPSVAIVTWLISTLLPHPDYIGTVTAPMMVLIFAAVTLMPEYQIMIWGLFPLKLIWVGLIVLLVNIVNLKTGYVGTVANLVGAGMGWSYIYTMRKGTDIVEVVWDWLENMKEKLTKKSDSSRDKTPFIKVQYKNTTDKTPKNITQDEIDRILDKINEKGYSSLTQEEREALKKASGSRKSDE